MPGKRPNFLVVMTDQMRADHLSCAGNPVIQTPNLDRLASEGVHATRAYVNCPLCMPGRASLFTGLTPRGHRVRTNGIPLDPSIPTMPGALAEAGYRTASIGKVHLSCYGLHPNQPEQECTAALFPEAYPHWVDGRIKGMPVPYFGLDHVEITINHGSHVHGDYAVWLQRKHPDQWKRLQEEEVEPSPLGAETCGTFVLDQRFHHTAYVADRTIEYLRNRDRESPFFLISSFPDPHHPYHAPEPWDRMYTPEDVVPPVGSEKDLDRLAPFYRETYDKDIQLSGRNHSTKMPEDQRREILAYTYGMVSQVDHHVGRVMAALEEAGCAEDTVVVFCSDHGDLMGDHGLVNKGPFHFEGLLRIPMIWRCPNRFPSRQTASLTSLLDVPATILDLAGVPIPTGPDSDEAPMQPPAWPGRSLVPLLAGETDSVQDSVVVENDEDYLGLRLRTLVTSTHKITTYTGHRGPEAFGELYDLTADSNEERNLWDEPGQRPLRSELVERLHHRLVETDIGVPRRVSHA
jgi:arylsulfatase A-like enzyme